MAQVGKLKTVFDKIKINTSRISTEFDETSKTTVLKSEIKTDMTPEVFLELSKQLWEIRNSFVI